MTAPPTLKGTATILPTPQPENRNITIIKINLIFFIIQFYHNFKHKKKLSKNLNFKVNLIHNYLYYSLKFIQNKGNKMAKVEDLKAKADDAKKAYLEALTKNSGDKDISEQQFDATTATVIEALNSLQDQIDVARAKGSIRAKDVIDGFGGEGRLNDLVLDLAGYMGEMTGAGVTLGSTPMVVMAGAAKGVYKKITE